MGRLSYLDFDLKIEREGTDYVTRVNCPAGQALNRFQMPFSDEKREILVLKLGRPRSKTRRICSEEMGAANELGGKLFDAVFRDEILGCLRSSQREVDRLKATGLRLKLWLKDVPELNDLPWEFLYDHASHRFLAHSNQTPIVRFIELPWAIQSLSISLPLRVLVAISRPNDRDCLDVGSERDCLEKAFGSLGREGKVRVEFQERATLKNLHHRLRNGEYHILHFIGHGGYDSRAGEGVLVLENDQGHSDQVGAHRIGTLLHDHRTLRLAVLNSCEGGRGSRTDPFTGVATTLIGQGVPAVVAMQFEITDEAAITFAGGFYDALAQGFPVDAAMAEARRAIYLFMSSDVEWGTPVLYMRSADGVLFDISQTIPPPVPSPPTTLGGHTSSVMSVAFSPDGATLASGSSDTTVRLWRASDGSPLRILEWPTKSGGVPTLIGWVGEALRLLWTERGVNSVAFSPDGATLASGSSDKTVRLWRASDGTLLRMLEGHTDSVQSVAFSPDGTTLASGSSDTTVRLWRASDGTLLRTLEGHTNWVNSVAFSPDGSTLASGSSDTTVRLWRASDGTLLRTLEGDTGWVNSVAFSPDGATLASGSLVNNVRLWRASDGTLLRTLEGHTLWERSLAFSPDGSTLASGSSDKTVRLWRASDGSLLHTLEGHTASVLSVAFSPDGSTLASGASDTTVRLWRLRT